MYVMALPDVGPSRAILTAVPVASVTEFWLPLECFDFGPGSKNGCPLKEYNHQVSYSTLPASFSLSFSFGF